MTARLAMVMLPLLLAASSPMSEGLARFESGDYAEAARAFEEGGPREEAPLRDYNAGVARLALGELDEAIARFEAAAVAAKGSLRAAALHDLALANALQGDALRQAPAGDESRDAAVARLTRAATGLRRALALFRRVPPPAPDSETGARAAKVRLLAVLDEIEKLEQEARREQEERALEHPERLILVLQAGQRDLRRVAVALAGVDRRRRRLPARRLRREISDARRLAEKLAVAIETPPAREGAPGAAPAAPDDTARRAAAEVREAAKAMGEAEGVLQGLDVEAARAPLGRAIESLRRAGILVPAPLPDLVAKLIDDQAGLLGLTRGAGALAPEEQGEVGAWLGPLTTLPEPPELPTSP